MFDHVSIGVRDIAKAKAFYDAALKPLGFTCLSADETSLGYGKKAVGFWIISRRAPGSRRPEVRPPLLLHRAEPGRASRRSIRRRWRRRARQRQAGPAQGLWAGLLRGLCLRSRRLSARSLLRGEISAMATIRSELKTRATASDVWSAIRDIGALHTRLVPGFVVEPRF